MKLKKNFSAIILSAGNSLRLGENRRKPFVPILGLPAMLYSLQAFESCPLVHEIIVVAQEQDYEETCQISKDFGITKFTRCVSGGKTRQKSAFAGVQGANKLATHFMIHDAARVLITAKMLENIAKLAVSHKAICPYVIPKDTIKLKSEQNMVTGTLNRNQLASIQTPQVFERELYFAAMNTAINQKQDYTDDCQLIEAINEPVFLCDGDYYNIKITTPEDLIFAKTILKER